jgi:hypothetical protein
MSDAHDLRRLRWLLGAYLFALFAYFGPGATWSPVSRFCLTRAIVEKGTLEITPFAPSTGDRAQVGERYYSDKAPLPSLLAVPAYAAFHQIARLRNRLPAFKVEEGTKERPAARVAVSPAFSAGLWVSSASTAGLSGTALGLMMLEVLRRRFALRTALAATLATVLGTPLLPYATSFFGHTIAAAMLFGAFALLDAPARRGRRIAAGALLGAAAGTEYVSAVPGLLILAYFVWRSPREERVALGAWVAAGAALPLLVVGAYHQACFGAPWRTAYSFVVRPSFAEGHARGLLGVTFPRADSLFGTLFGRSRGVFYVAPIAALAVIALASDWWKRRQPDRVLAFACVAVCLWINASYYMWNGGWATGPRHAVPGFGFLALGVALAFEWHGWARTLAFGAASLSVMIMVLTTAVGLEAPPDRDAIFGYLLPALQEGRIARLPGASNLGIALGLSKRMSAVPLLIFCALGAFWLLERAVRRETVES